MENESKKIKLINMQDVKPEEIKWLLPPFIPFGKITIVQGDPGEGKTTMMLQIIAKLTKGEPIIPHEDEKVEENKECKTAINVLYQTAEDGLGDTIKPRLLAAGADCSKVFVVDESECPLTMIDNRLEEAIVETSAKLVVLDPIQGYLGANVDMHRANEIRPVMKKLSSLAEKYQCAIVLVGHLNKNSIGKSSYRGLGSIDFLAAARSVLLVGRKKDDPELRVVCHVKSSLAPEGKSIAFRLNREEGFEWIGECDVSADDLLTGTAKGQKLREAKKFLTNMLSEQAVPQKEIMYEAQKDGIKEKTLYNAKKELGIHAIKDKNQWYWSLDESK